jgi:hypothetical protein
MLIKKIKIIVKIIKKYLKMENLINFNYLIKKKVIFKISIKINNKVIIILKIIFKIGLISYHH